MNKYNEFFAYIENKRMQESLHTDASGNLTIESLDLLKDRKDPNFLNGLLFYKLLFNFKRYIDLINNILPKNNKFNLNLEETSIKNMDNLLKVINQNTNDLEISRIAINSNTFLNPLFGDLNSSGGHFNIQGLKDEIWLGLFLIGDINNQNIYIFKVRGLSDQKGQPAVFNTNISNDMLLRIFVPSRDRNSYNSFGLENCLNPDILNRDKVLKKIEDNSNEKSIQKQNNISSGMNELQAKAASNIIHTFLNKLLEEDIFKNLYVKLFMGLEKDGNNPLIKLNLSNIASTIKPNLLYLGVKPIKFEEASSLKINSQGSTNLGSELAECYFNLFLNGPDASEVKNLISLMNKKSRGKTINKDYPTFEIFCKKLYGELINQLQTNKTTINDNNIIYTLGFKQGNYFKMENPLSCKFSIIVGKDIGRQSKLTNTVNFINGVSQLGAESSKNPKRTVQLRSTY